MPKRAYVFPMLACLAGLATADLAMAANPEVVAKNTAFAPATLHVKVGTTVAFRNADDTAHSFVAGDSSFNSHELAPGKSFDVTFKKVGTVPYFCGIHSFMEGKIVVDP